MQSPRMLWLLLVLIPVGYIMYLNFRDGRRELKRFKGHGPVEQLFDVFTIKWFFSSLFFFFFIVGVVLSLVGLQTNREQPEEEPIEADIIFAVDLSRSMRAEDVRPTRLDRAKAIMRGVLERVEKARFGVVLYKGSAYTLVPVTEDKNAVGGALEILSPSLFTSPGTDMEAGIRHAVSAFPGKEQRRRIILLFSDGESHGGRPVEAASLCAEEGIRLHTLGVGTKEGGRIPLGTEGYVRDGQGNPVISVLRESLMNRSAEAGNGVYVHVTGAETISPILERLELEADEGKVSYLAEGRYKPYLLISLIFLFLSIFVKVVPWRGTL